MILRAKFLSGNGFLGAIFSSSKQFWEPKSLTNMHFPIFIATCQISHIWDIGQGGKVHHLLRLFKRWRVFPGYYVGFNILIVVLCVMRGCWTVYCWRMRRVQCNLSSSWSWLTMYNTVQSYWSPGCSGCSCSCSGCKVTSVQHWLYCTTPHHCCHSTHLSLAEHPQHSFIITTTSQLRWLSQP